ncbi:MAG: hypothetical protein ACI9KK_002816 [Ascidiaceihabitans sp.]|jgi:hypothetical protein
MYSLLRAFLPKNKICLAFSLLFVRTVAFVIVGSLAAVLYG